jgi:O-antigen/teichoic acid export membrane protein
MLGILRSSTDVGLYNAAHPIAEFLSMPLSALWLIYMPVTAGLYAQGLQSEMKRNISVLTKWLSILTWPVFLILMFFPETVINFFFGTEYVSASTALRILSAGLIVNSLLGLAGSSLVAMGYTRFIMWTVVIAAVLNIVLNALLIPGYGIEGAAIASAAAITFNNVMRTFKLYRVTRFQPLSWQLLKPTLISSILLLIIYFIITGFVDVSFWMLALIGLFYLFIYGILVLLTKSLAQEDIALLLALEKKSGIRLGPVKRVVRRFL